MQRGPRSANFSLTGYQTRCKPPDGLNKPSTDPNPTLFPLTSINFPACTSLHLLRSPCYSGPNEHGHRGARRPRRPAPDQHGEQQQQQLVRQQPVLRRHGVPRPGGGGRQGQKAAHEVGRPSQGRVDEQGRDEAVIRRRRRKGPPTAQHGQHQRTRRQSASHLHPLSATITSPYPLPATISRPHPLPRTLARPLVSDLLGIDFAADVALALPFTRTRTRDPLPLRPDGDAQQRQRARWPVALRRPRIA